MRVGGDALVDLENSRLVVRWGKITADLSHWHFDTFAAYHRDHHYGFDTVTFELDASGTPDELVTIDQEGFRRVPNE